jgi:hypothetical protein
MGLGDGNGTLPHLEAWVHAEVSALDDAYIGVS